MEILVMKKTIDYIKITSSNGYQVNRWQIKGTSTASASCITGCICLKGFAEYFELPSVLKEFQLVASDKLPKYATSGAYTFRLVRGTERFKYYDESEIRWQITKLPRGTEECLQIKFKDIIRGNKEFYVWVEYE